MYYEEAVVKEYSRKDGRNNKQINLGVNSNYKKSDKVLIISSDKIETFKQNLEPKTKELEKELSVLQEENQKLKVDLEELKVEKEKIETLKNDIKETANKKRNGRQRQNFRNSEPTRRRIKTKGFRN